MKIQFQKPRFMAFLAFAAVLVCLYTVSMGHDFFFDEESIILNNPSIRNLSLIPALFKQGFFYVEGVPALNWTMYYRPLTAATFALDFSLWKFDPLGYNLTNLLLHLAVVWLLFRLIEKLCGDMRAAFLAAFLFAVHTMQTEAVSYIASRGDILGALGALGLILLYRHRKDPVALAVFAASLFAKESAVTFPFYLAAYELSFKSGDWKKASRRIAPFVLVSLAYVVFRKTFGPLPMGPPSVDWQGAPLRFLSMSEGYLKYLQALAAPDPFKFCDDIAFATKYSDPKVMLTLFMLALMLAAVAKAFKKRGPVLFGLLFFILSLGPYLHLIPFYPRWAEHYLYIPGIGLSILAACFAGNVLRRGPKTAAIFLALYAAFTAFLCVRTYERNLYYNDSENYYGALTQTSTPYAHFGYTNLGRIYFHEENFSKASVYFHTAVKIEPSEPIGYYNLGLYYLRLKDYQKAYDGFKKSYNLGNTGFPALHNAAVCLVYLKKYSDAASAFESARKLSPDNLDVHLNLIQTYCLAGDRAAARRWTQTALDQFKKKPFEIAMLRMAGAMAAYRFGDDQAARDYLGKIAEDSPGVFLYGDTALTATGKMDPSEFETSIPVRYKDYSAGAKSYLLMALVLRGDKDSAREYLDKNRAELESQPDKDPVLIKQELSRVEKRP